MVEKSESDHAGSVTRGPEFEPRKEDISETQQYIGQATGQTTGTPSTAPASQGNDQQVQQKKDEELAQIQKMKQEDETLRNQKIAEFRKQLQQIQQDQEHGAQSSNTGADQDKDYDRGMGQ